jgi:hypothetical protein
MGLRTVVAAIVIVTVAALLAAAPGAEAAPTRCKSADLRYPFRPDGPKTFGVFRLQVTNGTCKAAHRVARAWMAEFELELLLGRVRLPKRVAGYRFTSLPPNAAQTYRLWGRKAATTIRFDYVVPNS